MTSDKGASGQPLDERLSEARDGVLLDGENVVAQEMGDQGQAIVLTQSRIILLKAGLAATGTVNGQTNRAYPLQEITSVNVRKGPAGAVIQIATDRKARPAQGGPPDNVIVFSGARRVKKCDAIAAKIEQALDRPVERTGPTPEQQQAVERPNGDGEPVLRDEEISTEVEQSQAAAEEPAADTAEEESEEQEKAPSEFRPNPNLPKPIRKKRARPGRALVLIAVAAALLVGLAVTGPLKQPEKPPPARFDVGELSRSPSDIRRRYETVSEYRARVVKALGASRSSIARMENALRSGSKEAIESALRRDPTDDVWREVESLDPPVGLAEAKEHLVSGLFAVRTAIASVAGKHGSTDARNALRRLAEAQALVDKGVGTIDKMRSDLKKEMAAPRSAK